MPGVTQLEATRRRSPDGPQVPLEMTEFLVVPRLHLRHTTPKAGGRYAFLAIRTFGACFGSLGCADVDRVCFDCTSLCSAKRRVDLHRSQSATIEAPRLSASSRNAKVRGKYELIRNLLRFLLNQELAAQSQAGE